MIGIFLKYFKLITHIFFINIKTLMIYLIENKLFNDYNNWYFLE